MRGGQFGVNPKLILERRKIEMHEYEFRTSSLKKPLVVCGTIKGMWVSDYSEDTRYLVEDLGFIKKYDELTGEFKRLELLNGTLKEIIIEYEYEGTASIAVGVRDDSEFERVLKILFKLEKKYRIEW